MLFLPVFVFFHTGRPVGTKRGKKEKQDLKIVIRDTQKVGEEYIT